MLIVITNTERIGDVMKIGDISIHYLNGGNTKMDGGAMFGVVPKPLWSKQYNANERNQNQFTDTSNFDSNGSI